MSDVRGLASSIANLDSGSLQAPSASVVPRTLDGHPQGPALTMAPVSMITDGQVQGGMDTLIVLPISQIPDGQVQAPTMTTTFRAPDGQPQATTAAPPPLSRSSNGHPRVRTSSPPESQLSDDHPQTSTATTVSDIFEAQPPQASDASGSAPFASSSASVELVACRSEGGGDLELTLEDGILKDGQGRTGYIASNFQFQFDAPPQAGAIYTSGFSICTNGTLALGGSNIFYRCLSGNFYNLYDRYWAPQCSPVTIETLSFQDCA